MKYRSEDETVVFTSPFIIGFMRNQKFVFFYIDLQVLISLIKSSHPMGEIEIIMSKHTIPVEVTEFFFFTKYRHVS